MRLESATACCALALLVAPMLSPFVVAAQSSQGQATAPPFTGYFIKKAAADYDLDAQETERLRQIVALHANRLTSLRNRELSDPYNPSLQKEINEEQNAVQQEFIAELPEALRSKFSNTTITLIPGPPGFIPIPLPPERAMETAAEDGIMAAPPKGGWNKPLTGDLRILQLLARSTFGPLPGQISVVKKIGIDAFLDQQLNPESIDDSAVEERLKALPTGRLSMAELYQLYPDPTAAMSRAGQKNVPPVYGRPYQILGELEQQKLVRAVSSQRQLQEVMTDFWFNHFNIFAYKGGPELYTLPSYERDVIRANALGNFHDLLLAVAESPAMLYYLDNWLSTSPDAARPGRPLPPQPPKAKSAATPGSRGAGAFQARPVARVGGQSGQAVPGQSGAPEKAPGTSAKLPAKPAAKPAAGRKEGINENFGRELMELHTLGVDGGYTQKDVQEVARCLTGWTIDHIGDSPTFVFKPWMHDFGGKAVLGVTIPAGGGISDGLKVIDILSRQPATAHFISKELCERFVADDPPEKLVGRVAHVFLQTNGDLKQVVRAILTSPEFNSAQAFRSKVKSPLELAASAIRSVGGQTDGGPAIQGWIQRMGEPLYQVQPPTGYGETSGRWVNSGVFLNRLNFLVALAGNQIAGTSYNPAILARAGSSGRPMPEAVDAEVIHTSMPAPTRKALGDLEAGNAATASTGKLVPASYGSARLQTSKVLEVLFSSPEFQRR